MQLKTATTIADNKLFVGYSYDNSEHGYRIDLITFLKTGILKNLSTF